MKIKPISFLKLLTPRKNSSGRAGFELAPCLGENASLSPDQANKLFVGVSSLRSEMQLALKFHLRSYYQFSS